MTFHKYSLRTRRPSSTLDTGQPHLKRVQGRADLTSPTNGAPSDSPRARYPRAFWTANVVELFERSAFYAVFIALTLYLTELVGFDDVQAAWIGGVFTAGLYFLPPFTGAFADKIGFRRAILLAFSLLTIGYERITRWLESRASTGLVGGGGRGGA